MSRSLAKNHLILIIYYSAYKYFIFYLYLFVHRDQNIRVHDQKDSYK